MPRAVADMVMEARGHLQDSVSPYRYPDDDLVGYLNRALGSIRVLRPDYMVGVTGAFDGPITVDINDNYPLDHATELPVVYFMVGSAQLRDDEFAQDSRAIAMLGSFRSALVGGG